MNPVRSLVSLVEVTPMYRVTSVALGVIVAAAFVQSLLGNLAFGVLELAASLTVALAATVLSSYGIARLFGARAHLESAVITGFILFLIIWPSLRATDLVALAVAGVVASLSKFAIAWRGRHVLNPAAVGAFVISFAALGITSWWVGSASLVGVVLVVGLIVVLRVRALGYVAIYLLISGTARVVDVVSTTPGATPWAVLQESLGSSHVIFLAAFMLSEPLTTPAGRWQRVLVAAVVGALDAVPFAIGAFSSSPEFALLVGNALAFVLGRISAARLTVTGTRPLTADAVEVTFDTSRPVRFTPGQYVELQVPHSASDARGSRRFLSIVADEADVAARRIRVAVRVPADRPSSYKRALAGLETGAVVRSTGVYGRFALPRDRSKPLFLVAGGIGVTPILTQLALDGAGRDAVVLVVAPSADAMPYLDELAALPGIRLLLAETRADEATPGRWEHVAFTPEAVADAVPDLASRVALVSGPPRLIAAARTLLRGATRGRVRTDAFTGY